MTKWVPPCLLNILFPATQHGSGASSSHIAQPGKAGKPQRKGVMERGGFHTVLPQALGSPEAEGLPRGGRQENSSPPTTYHSTRIALLHQSDLSGGGRLGKTSCCPRVRTLKLAGIEGATGWGSCQTPPGAHQAASMAGLYAAGAV